jgi:type VI secretion system protein ImpE
MTAEQLFQSGHLADAIAEQNTQVKKRPTDVDARFMLYSLLCFAGDLERAEKQLDVLVAQDQALQSGCLVQRSLLCSEVERRRVFEGNALPLLPPDPPAWARLRVEALQWLRSGDPAKAEELIGRAIEQTPGIAGQLDGEPFEGVRDCDDLLASFVEIFAGGRYIWLPMDHVRRLEIEEPKSALDTLWRPAQLEDARGEQAQVHLPVLYAGSHLDADEGVRLGRMTHWSQEGGLERGRGQHVLLVARGDDCTEHGLLEIRELALPGAE